jgi:hypothetical protein
MKTKELDLGHILLARYGANLSATELDTLRRAERTLHRWAELECGNSDNYKSWSLERDEESGKPFMVYYPHVGASYRDPIPDREASALKRVAKVCQANGLHYFHQGDPRGCALWVSKDVLDGSNYTNGVAVA